MRRLILPIVLSVSPLPDTFPVATLEVTSIIQGESG